MTISKHTNIHTWTEKFSVNEVAEHFIDAPVSISTAFGLYQKAGGLMSRISFFRKARELKAAGRFEETPIRRRNNKREPGCVMVVGYQLKADPAAVDKPQTV